MGCCALEGGDAVSAISITNLMSCAAQALPLVSAGGTGDEPQKIEVEARPQNAVGAPERGCHRRRSDHAHGSCQGRSAPLSQSAASVPSRPICIG
jgi:hypothetical protein